MEILDLVESFSIFINEHTELSAWSGSKNLLYAPYFPDRIVIFGLNGTKMCAIVNFNANHCTIIASAFESSATIDYADPEFSFENIAGILEGL